MSASLAANLKFGRVLIEDAKAVERVASVISRPSFAAFDRVRWTANLRPDVNEHGVLPEVSVGWQSDCA